MLVSRYVVGRAAALISSAAISLLFCEVAHSAQIVSFGLPDYAELGYVRDRIRPAYQELENGSLNLSASLKYSDLATQSVSTASDILGGGAIGDVASIYGALSNLNGISDAQSLGGLGASFSPIDTSKATASLNNLGIALNELNAQISNPIEPPTLQLYYAVAVSGNARKKASDLRTDALNGRTSLQNSLSNINSLNATLRSYSGQLDETEKVADQLTRRLFELVQVPGPNLLIKPLLENILATQIVIYEQKRLVSNTLTQLARSAETINQRINETNDLINSVDFALTAEPLPSKWEIYGFDLSSSFGYDLSFVGKSFDSPYTEIDGPFLLGALTIFNGLGRIGVDNTTLEFEALRTVLDPLLGQVQTKGKASINMSYVTTPNGDDPRTSADYFKVPSLGINLHIYESDSFSVNVYGQYNSPLRIVALEPVSGSTGGFIMPITIPMPTPEPTPTPTPRTVPEPGTVGAILLISFVGLRYGKRGS